MIRTESLKGEPQKCLHGASPPQAHPIPFTCMPPAGAPVGRDALTAAQSSPRVSANRTLAPPRGEVFRRSTPSVAVILATVRTLSSREERKDRQVRGTPGSRLLEPRRKRKPLPSTGSFTVATAACSCRTAKSRLSPGHIVKDRVPFLTNREPGRKASPSCTFTTEALGTGFAMRANLQPTVSASSFCRPQHPAHWQVAELLIVLGRCFNY